MYYYWWPFLVHPLHNGEFDLDTALYIAMYDSHKKISCGAVQQIPQGW